MTRRTRRDRGKAESAKSAAQTAEDREGIRTSRLELACWALLLAVSLGGLIWEHSATYFYSWTDEQIHLYVARRLAEGAVLYRDVDSARPPLALLPVAWLIRAGCSPLCAGRVFVLANQLGIAALLFWGGRALLSWRAGTLAAVLFLSCPDTVSRIHYTGIHLVALATLASVLLSLRGRPLWAGCCFGLSLAAGQHGTVMCGIAALIAIRHHRRDGIYFGSGTLIVTATIFGSVWAIGGRHIWEDLVKHHLYHLQPGGSGTVVFWELARPWLYEHAYLFVGMVMAIILSRSRHGEVGGDAAVPRLRPSSLLLLIVGAHVAAVLAMSGAVFLWVAMIVPLLTLLAGMGIDATLVSYRRRQQLSRVQAQRVSRLTLAGMVAVMVLMFGGWSAARSHRESLDERAYSFWPHVRHAQVALFQRLDLARLLASDPMLPKTGTLFGEPTIVSAVALQSGLRVSAELADLDFSWIGGGTVRRDQVVSRIERDGVVAVITPPWFMVQDSFFRSYLMACYQEPTVFYPPESGPGAGIPEILLFLHVHDHSPCSPSVQK